LLEGAEVKRKTYALDRTSREAALLRLFADPTDAAFATIGVGWLNGVWWFSTTVGKFDRDPVTVYSRSSTQARTIDLYERTTDNSRRR
jgi:hypothetical protein